MIVAASVLAIWSNLAILYLIAIAAFAVVLLTRKPRHVSRHDAPDERCFPEHVGRRQ